MLYICFSIFKYKHPSCRYSGTVAVHENVSPPSGKPLTLNGNIFIYGVYIFDKNLLYAEMESII